MDYYDSVDQLLQEEDIVETDVKVSGWKRQFRIRALTFAQMVRINQKSLVTDEKTQKTSTDEALFSYWTIVEGVTRPKFTFVKAEQLADKNGVFVKELTDQIWDLGRIDKSKWDEYINTIKEANELAAKEKK